MPVLCISKNTQTQAHLVQSLMSAMQLFKISTNADTTHMKTVSMYQTLTLLHE